MSSFGQITSGRARRRVTSVVALMVAAAVAAGPATAGAPVVARAFEAPDDAAVRSIPDPTKTEPSRGVGTEPRKPAADTESDAVFVKPVWPKPGRFAAQVPGPRARAAFADAGSSPFSVARPEALPTGQEGTPVGAAAAVSQAVVPQAVVVEVASQAAARAAGVPGVLVRVEAAAAGPVAMALDYSGFRDAYGADWATRLRLVRFPDCVLTTPELAECRAGVPVASTNDSATQSVTAVLDLGADGSAQDYPVPVDTVAGDPTLEPMMTTGPTPVPSADPQPEATSEPTASGPPGSGPDAAGDPAVSPTVEPVPSEHATPAATDRAAPVRAAMLVASDTASTSATYGYTAAAAGPNGDFTATSLSMASAWEGGGSSGAATWSYPLPVPPVPGGLAPSLALDYNSGAVDGMTSAKNNQASWIGEGFALAPGFIERKYVTCAADEAAITVTVGATSSTHAANNAGLPRGDLCWRTNNAFLSMGGSASELIATGKDDEWRKRFDDGSRIRHHVVGSGADRREHWTLTTAAGVIYVFGRGETSTGESTGSAWTVPVYSNHVTEPGHGDTFADSVHTREWRWNLDEVRDPLGNRINYFWTPETNHYAQDGQKLSPKKYVRGGHLHRIDYGLHGSDTAPAARVELVAADRKSAAGNWPDTPTDLLCDAEGECTETAPTFFTKKKLTEVRTEVAKYGEPGVYERVDTWALRHEFPGGDSGELWLEEIVHTAAGGTALPPVKLGGEMMENRVDAIGDSAPALNRRRLNLVQTESGAQIRFSYTAQDCTPALVKDLKPESNERLCFPAMYTPNDAADPKVHWFHKYLVKRIEVTDLFDRDAEPVVTTYTYGGAPAWAFDDSPLIKRKHRSWNQWRGYGVVTTNTGATGGNVKRTETETRYYRGMDGDCLTKDCDGAGRDVEVVDSEGGRHDDHWRFAGMARETIVRNGPGGATVSKTITEAWKSEPTAAVGPHTTLSAGPDDKPALLQDARVHRAILAGAGQVTAYSPLSGGGQRVATVVTTHDDSYGMPVGVSDIAEDIRGGVVKDRDVRCTDIDYVRNENTWLLDRVQQVKTYATCAANPEPGKLIAWTRHYYDDANTDLSATPTEGRRTRTEALEKEGGTFLPTTYQHDKFGRQTSIENALGHRTTTSYAITDKGTVVTTSSDPDDAGTASLPAHVSVATIEPRRGMATTVKEPSGRTTQADYDAYGRTTSVWLNSRAKSAAADLTYSYVLGSNGQNSVTTKRRVTTADGPTYIESIEILDGLLRHKQTQTAVPETENLAAGRLADGTKYDSRGLAVTVLEPKHLLGAPSTTALMPDVLQDWHTSTDYDGAGRPTAVAFRDGAAEHSRSSTVYDGEVTIVTPPTGAAMTSTVTDVRGRTAVLRQHPAREIGAFLATSYGYSDAGHLTRMQDPAGNIWTWTHDLLGRQTHSDDPDRGKAGAEFDRLGRMVKSTDAKDQSLGYTYDNLGRRTSVRAGSATGPILSEWTYDRVVANEHVPGGWVRAGLPATSARTIAGKKVLTQIIGYDGADRPRGSATTVPVIDGLVEGSLAGTYTVEQDYHEDGALKSTRIGGYNNVFKGEELRYAYDGAGRLAALAGAGTYVSDTLRTAFGEAERIAYGNTFGSTAWQDFRYHDGTRLLAKAELSRQVAAVADEVVTYAYDKAGNPTKVDAALVSGPLTQRDTQCFAYDGLGQLTDAWTPAATASPCTNPAETTAAPGANPAPYAAAWTFDNTTGNRAKEVLRIPGVTQTTSTYTYQQSGGRDTHRLAAVSTDGPAGTQLDSFGYDLVGNTTARALHGKAAQTLTWDAEGHLTKVEAGGIVRSEAWYDTDGSRLIHRETTPDGSKATTLTLGDTEITSTLPAAGGTAVTTWKRYYDFDGKTVAVRDGDKTTDVQILISDRHNTAGYAIESADLAITARRSLPYGGPRGGGPTGWVSDRSFVGGTLDDSVGLTHIGSREYDPHTGRFISVDPVLIPTDPQQATAYGYARNNPMTFADPTGLCVPIGSDSSAGCYDSDSRMVAGHGRPAESIEDYGRHQAAKREILPSCSVCHVQSELDASQKAQAETQLTASRITDNSSKWSAGLRGAWQGFNWIVPVEDIISCPTGGGALACAGVIPGPAGRGIKAGAKGIDEAADLARGGQRANEAARTTERASALDRTGSALTKGDPFHRSVSWVVDNPVAQRFAIKGGDGVSRELYQLPGEVNGKSGVFEWIIDRSGSKPVINHQRFIPGGSVSGFPNQVVQ